MYAFINTRELKHNPILYRTYRLETTRVGTTLSLCGCDPNPPTWRTVTKTHMRDATSTHLHATTHHPDYPCDPAAFLRQDNRLSVDPHHGPWTPDLSLRTLTFIASTPKKNAFLLALPLRACRHRCCYRSHQNKAQPAFCVGQNNGA